MKKIILPLFVFLFILLISSSGYAYITVDLNVSYTGNYWYHRDVTCDENNCWFLTQNTGGSPYYVTIERFNLTLQDREYCSTGQTGATGLSFVEGITLANSTHLFMPYTNGSIAYVDISNMASHSCPTTFSGTHTEVSGSTPYYTGCGFYNVTPDASSAWVYCGRSMGYLNSTTGVDTGISIFHSSSVTKLKLPNSTSNTTIYGMKDAVFYKYTNGAFEKNINTIEDTYGVSRTGDIYDVVDIGDTTYIYFLHFSGAGSLETPDYLYRANFTAADESGGGSTIEAVSPINNATAASNPPQLHIQAIAASNGTITWYVDGVYAGNTTVVNSTSYVQYYFSPSAAQSTGNHTWEANFTDSFGYIWPSGQQRYLIGLPSLFIDPLEYFAAQTGAFFSVEDLDTSKNIFGLLISMLVAFLCVLILGVKIKRPDSGTLIGIFFGTFIVSVLIFTLTGFVAGWVMLALFGLFALIAYMVLKGGG